MQKPEAGMNTCTRIRQGRKTEEDYIQLSKTHSTEQLHSYIVLWYIVIVWNRLFGNNCDNPEPITQRWGSGGTLRWKRWQPSVKSAEYAVADPRTDRESYLQWQASADTVVVVETNTDFLIYMTRYKFFYEESHYYLWRISFWNTTHKNTWDLLFMY